MNHLNEEDLILLYYREPSASDAARSHLAACPECRVAAESLARTLDLCNEWTVPEPDPELERSVWARIAPQLEDRRVRMLGVSPRWLAGFAVAALVIVAFVVGSTMGRNSRHAAPSLTAGLSAQARERILAITLADHLDRAGMLLTEVSNAADSDVEGFDSERARAQDLVEEGRLMRQVMAEQTGSRGETATLNLLDDVERFMLELANAPDRVDPRQIREFQRRVASGSLLFKVKIIESNLRTKGQRS